MNTTNECIFLGSPMNTTLQIACLVVPPHHRSDCLKELQSEGFYDIVGDSDIETIKNRFRLTGDVENNLFSDDINRVAFIDFETAAEAGVVSLFDEINNVTVYRNIQFSSILEEWSGGEDDNYTVKVDDFQAILWSRDELVQAENSRLFAGDRFITFVNWMLTSVGSAERFYYQYTGNDTLIVLLTDRMYRTLHTFNAIHIFNAGSGPV